MALEPLPIDPYLPQIREAVRAHRAAVITAAPGAGKTTRVPPAVLEDGRAVVLQPRRVAARAIARRIAHERGWTLGDEVGWQVRFDRRGTDRTRLMIVTEGVLTAYLQRDPLLSQFSTIVVDEFHERSVHADLALAFARQAWRARDDLRIVVMSATLEVAPIVRFLEGCPAIDVPGRVHPIEMLYAPGQPLPSAIADALGRSPGHVLAFLPGAPEIERALPEVTAAARGAEVLPLHGSLEAESQDRVFRPASSRRVVLATNIAETSITVPNVTAVVDSGLHKVARYDAGRAIDSLELERVPQDAADQRAGRAGRTAPGVAIRLWDRRDRLRAHREPEIDRIDLSAAVLDVIAWGADPRTFEWFEAPPEENLEQAARLLERLGAVDVGRLTPIGEQLRRLPLHPRLGRILLEAGGAFEAAVVCAVLSERSFVPARGSAATTSDLLTAVDQFGRLPPHVRHVAQQVHGLGRRAMGESASDHVTEEALRRAIFFGYPDRLARRRSHGTPRLLLASGHGALLLPESGVTEGEFLVAVDVQAGRAGPGSEARVRITSRVEPSWFEPHLTVSREHRFESASGTVRAVELRKYDEIVVSERAADVDREEAARLFAAAILNRDPSAGDVQLLRRLKFAGHPIALEDLAKTAVRGARRLTDVSLGAAVPSEVRAVLEREAPERLRVPSGRTVALEYQDDGTVQAAVKLQELFGLADTPRIGSRREPVVLLLLGPNGRPVQTTRDLRSFWDRTYPDVRRELRGRYPRHPWPEDPWTAPPTSKTTKRRPPRG